jgi:hypothetical protein
MPHLVCALLLACGRDEVSSPVTPSSPPPAVVADARSAAIPDAPIAVAVPAIDAALPADAAVRGVRGTGDGKIDCCRPTLGGPRDDGDVGPVGRIRVDSVQPLDDSTLTPDTVTAKLIAAYMPGIRRCYREVLKRDPKAEGKLTLALTVTATSRVASPKATGVSGDCVASLMGAWHFPIPTDKDGAATDASFRITLVLVPD